MVYINNWLHWETEVLEAGLFCWEAEAEAVELDCFRFQVLYILNQVLSLWQDELLNCQTTAKAQANDKPQPKPKQSQINQKLGLKLSIYITMCVHIKYFFCLKLRIYFVHL